MTYGWVMLFQVLGLLGLIGAVRGDLECVAAVARKREMVCVQPDRRSLALLIAHGGGV